MTIRRKPITSNCTPAIPETLEDAKGCKVYIDTVANQCWLTAETEPNGNVWSQKSVPMTLAARGVRAELWDALAGDLLRLPPVGLTPKECVLAATLGCPVYVCPLVSGSHRTCLGDGRRGAWIELANAVCRRHAPAFAAHGVALEAAAATDAISVVHVEEHEGVADRRGHRNGGMGAHDIPWEGTCIAFSWPPPATAIVRREVPPPAPTTAARLKGVFGGPAPPPPEPTYVWETLPLGPADARCARAPVPPGTAPGARLQVAFPHGIQQAPRARASPSGSPTGYSVAFQVQVPDPPPTMLLVQLPSMDDLRFTPHDPSLPTIESVPAPTLQELAAGTRLAAPAAPQMSRDVVGHVVGVPGANPVVVGARAAPPAAQVVDVQPPEQEMVPAVTLQVPAGAGPGSVVSYTLPDGRAVAVTIPPNLKPGDRFPFVPPR